MLYSGDEFYDDDITGGPIDNEDLEDWRDAYSYEEESGLTDDRVLDNALDR